MFKKISLFLLLLSFSFNTAITFSAEKDKNLEKLPKELFDNTPLEPVKVFDNLYCFGTKSVVVWALKTSEGIILIDSMWDNNDAKMVADNMKKVGLNPEDIKYVIISHGHGDHYGGAQYFKDHYKSKILISEVDNELMLNSNEGANGPRSPKAKADIFVKDMEKITLGDTTVTIVSTPGHTPGGISMIFPVKENGFTYMAGIWGGTGLPKSDDDIKNYINSTEYFKNIAKKANVSVEITAHLFTENGYKKLEKSKNRNFEEPNPFFLGNSGFSEYLDNLGNLGKKTLEKNRELEKK